MERAFTKRNPFRCNGPLQRNEIPFVKPFAANLGGQARDAPDDPQMWQERCFSTSLATSGGHLVHLWVVGGLGTGGFLKKKIKLNDTKGSPGVPGVPRGPQESQDPQEPPRDPKDTQGPPWTPKFQTLTHFSPAHWSLC